MLVVTTTMALDSQVVVVSYSSTSFLRVVVVANVLCQAAVTRVVDPTSIEVRTGLSMVRQQCLHLIPAP